jgi:hypothetical protein
MVPRDGTSNKHGTQRRNFKQAWYPEMELQTSMVPRDETLNMHGAQRWNFKQAWYPEMEL